MRQRTAEDIADSSPHVEHLRLVHFSLTVVCLTLLVATSLDPSGEYSSAYRQLREIRRLHELFQDTSWLQKHAAAKYEKQLARLGEPLGMPDYLVAYLEDDPEAKQPYRLELPKDNWMVAGPASHPLEISPLVELGGNSGTHENPNLVDEARWRANTLSAYTIILRAPANLSEFAAFWDKLAAADYIYTATTIDTQDGVSWMPQRNVREAVHNRHEIDKRFQFAQFTSQGKLIKRRASRGMPTKDWSKESIPPERHHYMRLRPNRAQQADPSVMGQVDLIPAHLRRQFSGATHRFETALQAIGSSRVFSIPLRCSTMQLDTQMYLRDQANADWDLGTFAETFAELSETTKAIATLPFEQIESILNAQRLSERDRVELFGVKFPTNALNTWGLIMLVAVQLYFWLHLIGFSTVVQDNDKAWTMPWIGLYDSFLARFTYAVSIVALPIAVIVQLLKGGLLPITIAVLSISLATLTVSTSIRLHHRMRKQKSSRA